MMAQRLRLSLPADARQRAGWVLLPLRAFLGVTFTFAGAQKLANPGFFDASKPGSIQMQMAAAARLSPLHSLVSHLQHDAVAVGVIIALAELAVGVGTLLGVYARVAAVGGVLLALVLFLTVSYHSRPYYTGSDIVFAFAWLPLVITGAGGVLSLDAWVAGGRAGLAGPGEPQPGAPSGPEGETGRRAVITKGARGALVFLAGAVVAGLDAAIGRLIGSATRPGGVVALKQRPGAAGAGAGGGVATPPGHPIGPASGVPVGGAAAFNDPATGDTSLVIQPVAGAFQAFDAICPHQGCTVQYFPSQKLFICPCHQSEFDATTGEVRSGPAATGLTPITIGVGPDGQLYAI
jgi:thiosulfate dehydrogenase [quinone] large subunit